MLAYHIETFGCQMNEQDTLRLERCLNEAGGNWVSDPAEADLLIINTCSIRRKAEEKAYSLLGRYRSLKKRRPGLMIAVGGCVAQQEGNRLLQRLPHIDMVFGPHHVQSIVTMVEQFQNRQERFVQVSHAEGTAEDLECSGIPDKSGLRAYMTIMEGCDNFCSYCIVPYVRGRERSRPFRSVIEEAKRLVDMGVREVTLLGQNVNAYRAPDRKGFLFPDLLSRINEVSGLRRLRFTTSHPKDLSPELIQCFGDLESLCEHIHLPLQAGSDRILAAMNRGYSRSDYLERIAGLRYRVPEIAITSDMIVGFPGEGEQEFLESLDILEKIQFDNLFSFKFSPRPGTRASRLEDETSEQEKGQRLRVLQDLQKSITKAKNKEMEGKFAEVFVEGRGRDERQWTGRTRTNKIVNFDSSDSMLGRFLDVHVERGYQNSLLGALGKE